MPALMTLNSPLTLLLLMASRQQEMTWFLGFPTEEIKARETWVDVRRKGRSKRTKRRSCILWST